jgi:hypothetical protein
MTVTATVTKDVSRQVRDDRSTLRDDLRAAIVTTKSLKNITW